MDRGTARTDQAISCIDQPMGQLEHAIVPKNHAMSPMDCVPEGLKPLAGGFAAWRYHRTTSPEINQNRGRDSSKPAFDPNARCPYQPCREGFAPDASSCRFSSGVKDRSCTSKVVVCLTQTCCHPSGMGSSLSLRTGGVALRRNHRLTALVLPGHF